MDLHGRSLSLNLKSENTFYKSPFVYIVIKNEWLENKRHNENVCWHKNTPLFNVKKYTIFDKKRKIQYRSIFCLYSQNEFLTRLFVHVETYQLNPNLKYCNHFWLRIFFFYSLLLVKINSISMHVHVNWFEHILLYMYI